MMAIRTKAWMREASEIMDFLFASPRASALALSVFPKGIIFSLFLENKVMELKGSPLYITG